MNTERLSEVSLSLAFAFAENPPTVLPVSQVYNRMILAEPSSIPATASPPETNVSELKGRSEAQMDGENVHAEGGVLVAVSRGLTLDSPRETLASHQQINFGAESAQNALSETTPRALGSFHTGWQMQALGEMF